MVKIHKHKGTDSQRILHKDLMGIDPSKSVHDDRYIYKENTKAFTPDADYEPATKKYVDDSGEIELTKKAYIAGEGVKAGEAIFISDGNESDVDMVERNSATTAGGWGTTAIGHYAQSFQFDHAQNILKIVLKLGKNSSPTDNITIGIKADSGGSPTGDFLGSQTFDGSTLGALAEVTVTLNAVVPVDADTLYWIVVIRSGALDNTNYYSMAHNASNGYANGVLKTSTDGSTWGTGTYGDDDSHFRFILEFTAGKAYLTRADVENTAMAYGIAEDTVAPLSETDLITNGISTVQTGLTAGTPYYTSTTPGAIGTSVPAFGNYVGIALTATSLLLIIREAIAEAGSSLAGDKLISSTDAGAGGNTVPYVKVRETEIVKDGTLRIKFTLTTQAAGQTATGRVYKNAAAVGTERTTVSTGGEEFSEDISGWSVGDLVQIYYHGTGSNNVIITNFRIYADKYEVATVIL